MSEMSQTRSLAQGLSYRPTDIFIAVMGVTGSGKSTFISLLAEQQVEVGHTLQACTRKVDAYSFDYSPNCTVYLIDTPGFDDTNRSDTEVLREIASWLTESYSNALKLNGIIQLHRVSDVRMPGSAKRNIMMFKKLCGKDALKNVVLCTTMWDKTTPEEGAEREGELVSTSDFWGWMKSQGSKVCRHDGDRASALRLVEHFVTKGSQVVLDIQHQMVEEKKDLNETSAGIELEAELIKERKKYQDHLKEVQETIAEAIRERDDEMARTLQELQEDYRAEMKRLSRDREELKISMQSLHEAKYAELTQRLESQQVAHREELRKIAEESRKREDELAAERLRLADELRELQISTAGTSPTYAESAFDMPPYDPEPSLSPRSETRDECYLNYFGCRIMRSDMKSIDRDFNLKIVEFWLEYLERQELFKQASSRIVLIRPLDAIKLAFTRFPQATVNKDEDKETLGISAISENTTHVFVPICITYVSDVGVSLARTRPRQDWSLLLVSLVDGYSCHYDFNDGLSGSSARTAIKNLNTVLNCSLSLKECTNCPQWEKDVTETGVYTVLTLRHLLLKRILSASPREVVSVDMSGKMIDGPGGRKETRRLIQKIKETGRK